MRFLPPTKFLLRRVVAIGVWGALEFFRRAYGFEFLFWVELAVVALTFVFLPNDFFGFKEKTQ